MTRPGRIFTHEKIIYLITLLSFSSFTEVAQFICYLFLSKSYVFFNQNVLGYILGDFFTNSSDHPWPNTTRPL
jgi:hypothetical protein